MDSLLLSKTILFQGISPSETEKALLELDPVEKTYLPGEYILTAGETVTAICIVIAGSLNIERDDLWGNRSILNHISQGQIFAETYACCPEEALTVNAVASEKCSVLFLEFQQLWNLCTRKGTVHSRLLLNLLYVLAEKNMRLTDRMRHTAPKSIRSRVTSYLSDLSRKQHSESIRIPFDRQQLADYLGVDRSALSKELGKMKKEGLIDVRKNYFHILQSPEE